jgi:thymidylate kinase
MFIVIEGIDGSGKSTLARLLARELNGGQLPAGPGGKTEIGAAAAQTRARADQLRTLIWASPESEGDTFGAAHWILLIASWYAGLARLRPDLAPGWSGVTVMDGWYYRNIAKTVIREPLDPHWVESLFAPVPEPDVTVLLDTAPSVAWQRRTAFKDTELGRWDGFTGPPEESFLAYQSIVREQLLRMARDRDWLVRAPVPDETPRETAAAVARDIRGRLTVPRDPSPRPVRRSWPSASSKESTRR